MCTKNPGVAQGEGARSPWGVTAAYPPTHSQLLTPQVSGEPERFSRAWKVWAQVWRSQPREERGLPGRWKEL